MKPQRHILTKSTYIRGLQCPKSLYLHKKRPFLRDPLPPSQQARFARGTEVGLLAQNIFPGGIDLKPKTPFQYPQALSNTAGAMDDSSVKVIYEASFQYEGVLVVTDILTRDGNGWVAYEVKSSAEISETFREDIALQYFVLSNSGVKLIDFRILYLNKDYKRRPNLELKELFLDESLMEDALSRQDKVQKKVMELTAVTRLSSSPKIATGTHCLRPYPCDFIGHCWKGKPPRTSFPGDAPVDTDLLQQTFQAHQPGMAYLELLLTRPAIPLFEGYGPYEALLAGYGLAPLSNDTQQAHLSDLLKDGPEHILRMLIGQTRAYASLIVFDQDTVRKFLEDSMVHFPLLREELNTLKMKISGWISAPLKQLWHPMDRKEKIEPADVAAAMGDSRLKNGLIDGPGLAGEIYRQLFLSDRKPPKSFTQEVLMNYLSDSLHALRHGHDHLRSLIQ